MTIFTQDKLKAIKTTAVQFGFTEIADKPGIFMNDKQIIINSLVRTGVTGYIGLPMIGKYDRGVTDENDSSPTIEQVRGAIAAAFKALPKTKLKVEYDSATAKQEYKAPEAPKERPTAPLIDDLKNKEKKDEPKIETKTENKIPEKQSASSAFVEASNEWHKPSKPEQKKPIDDSNLTNKSSFIHQCTDATMKNGVCVECGAIAKKPTIVKNCRACGFALEPKRAMECFERDPQEPIFICVECDAKKPEPKQAEVMPPQERASQPSRTIPGKVVTQKGLMIKNLTLKCAEIGGIRIGTKGENTTGSGYRLPQKLDHFIVTTPNKDKGGNFILDDVMGLLPENPRSLDIMLLYDDETMNFSTQYREMKGGRVVCSGDGERAFDKEAGMEIICNTDTCPKYLAKKCKLNGTLSVILLNKPTIGGVYRFRTTGWNSVQSIMTSMLMIKTLTRGLLAMIPLKLTLTPKLVTPKGTDKAHTIYFVNIEYHGSDLLEQVIKISNHRMAMQSEIKKLETQSLLSAPESEEELKDIQDEFYPGQV